MDKIKDVIVRHRKRKERSLEKEWGKEFVIYENVFSPFIAPSGRVGLSFASLPIFKDKKILDIGCGSGVIASLMALNGAEKVLGVDINETAVNNARSNAISLGLEEQLEFRYSDCLSSVKSEEKFDLVYADLPFTDGQPKDILESAFYDPELSSIRKLITEYPLHKGLSKAALYLVMSDAEDMNLHEVAYIHGLSASSFLDIHYPWIKISIFELRRIA